jgi:hypothetical protein
LRLSVDGGSGGGAGFGGGGGGGGGDQGGADVASDDLCTALCTRARKSGAHANQVIRESKLDVLDAAVAPFLDPSQCSLVGHSSDGLDADAGPTSVMGVVPGMFKPKPGGDVEPTSTSSSARALSSTSAVVTNKQTVFPAHTQPMSARIGVHRDQGLFARIEPEAAQSETPLVATTTEGAKTQQAGPTTGRPTVTQGRGNPFAALMIADDDDSGHSDDDNDGDGDHGGRDRH